MYQTLFGESTAGRGQVVGGRAVGLANSDAGVNPRSGLPYA
jgi:hypothetical protein